MSFPVPAAAPDAAPYVCARLNVSWVSHLIGAAEIMRRAGYFTGTDAELFTADQSVQAIQQQLAQGVCVSIPVGLMMVNPAVDPPDGWLTCDGSSFDTFQYPDLAAYLAPHFTVGGVVRVPDMRGRYAVGHEVGGSDGIGQPVGDNDRTLTIAQMPAHTHTQQPHKHSSPSRGNSAIGSAGILMHGNNSGTARTTDTYDTTAINDPTGGGESFDNRPNSLTLNWIIKASA